ncbi:MAG: MBL fold metallo-hydrolase [Clostridia bacterium]|nr:MBL fold metallo-hydrolase [Clostridia bacterium]
MDITYIHHSGFLIEWDTSYWLFDYYKGDLPEMDSKKKLIIFASHKHTDHFNPEIFKLNEQFYDVEYVLSSDIKLRKEFFHKTDAADKQLDKIVFVKPSNQYDIEDGQGSTILLKTLQSTDCGVAFLLQYKGKIIYHAGDLNLWTWKEESPKYNENMTARFNKEMIMLKDIAIDVAFAPLDPRQEEWYYLGMDRLLNTAKVRYIFPMHFWDNPAIIQQFKRERAMNLNCAIVMDVSRDGQKWNVEV